MLPRIHKIFLSNFLFSFIVAMIPLLCHCSLIYRMRVIWLKSCYMPRGMLIFCNQCLSQLYDMYIPFSIFSTSTVKEIDWRVSVSPKLHKQQILMNHEIHLKYFILSGNICILSRKFRVKSRTLHSNFSKITRLTQDSKSRT